MNSSHQKPLNVLAVCTANLCRSPLMEHLLRDAVDRHSIDWSIRSGGTRAEAGQAAHRHVQRILSEWNISLGDWRTTPLTEERVSDADLVITASEIHRTQVAEIDPSALTRTYPLLQFAYLLSSPDARRAGPPPTAHGLVEWLSDARTRVQPPPRHSFDLADPMGKSLRRFRQTAVIVDTAINKITHSLIEAKTGTHATG